jgi:hypothetical protein
MRIGDLFLQRLPLTDSLGTDLFERYKIVADLFIDVFVCFNPLIPTLQGISMSSFWVHASPEKQPARSEGLKLDM